MKGINIKNEIKHKTIQIEKCQPNHNKSADAAAKWKSNNNDLLIIKFKKLMILILLLLFNYY